MKDDKIALNFSEKFILEGIYEIPSPKGGTFDAYGIIIPDKDYDENGVKRILLVNVKYVYRSAKFKNGRYTYLLEEHEYPICYTDGFTEDGKYILTRSQEKMTGLEIVESFRRYRAGLRKTFEDRFIPKKEEE